MKCRYLKTKMIRVSATYFQPSDRSFPLKSFWMILDSHNTLNSITLVSAKNCRVLWQYKWVSMNLFSSIFINRNNFRENFKNISLIKCPYFNSTVIIGDNVTVTCTMIKTQRNVSWYCQQSYGFPCTVQKLFVPIFFFFESLIFCYFTVFLI